MKYKIGNVEVEAVQFDGYNLTEINNFLYGGSIDKCNKSDYIVKTEESLFTLSEQDFNNMVTKVKEPKFKVGDVVYWIVEDDDMNIEKVTVTKNVINDNFVHVEGHFHAIDMSQLFTLEEAIEKLKEL